jgi:hypothetical protein
MHGYVLRPGHPSGFVSASATTTSALGIMPTERRSFRYW